VGKVGSREGLKRPEVGLSIGTYEIKKRWPCRDSLARGDRTTIKGGHKGESTIKKEEKRFEVRMGVCQANRHKSPSLRPGVLRDYSTTQNRREVTIDSLKRGLANKEMIRLRRGCKLISLGYNSYTRHHTVEGTMDAYVREGVFSA